MRNKFCNITLAFCIIVLLYACAKKNSEVEFKPLQMHWFAAENVIDSTMQNKDNCVIKLTSSLMAEPLVQSSTIGELNYNVIYKSNANGPSTLYFKGFCADSSIINLPECSWSATCNNELKTVVKFHNNK